MENYRPRSFGAEGGALRSGAWPGSSELFWGRWRNRGLKLARWWWWWGWGRVGIDMRVEKWVREMGGKGEELGRGGLCLVDEMQVLYKNGWMHI